MTAYNEKYRSHQRLYRDSRHGRIMGVCAGIAEYFGFNVTATRALAILALLFFPPFTLITYVILGIVLPRKPEDQDDEPEERNFWQGVRRAPKDTFSEVRHRFREMEVRLGRMETYVTSDRYDLDRKFRDLEDS